MTELANFPSNLSPVPQSLECFLLRGEGKNETKPPVPVVMNLLSPKMTHLLSAPLHRSGWRPSHSAEASRYVFSGLWKAIRPPPGLLTTAISTSRLVLGRWCCLCGGADDNSRRGRQRRKDEGSAALKRLGLGGLGLRVGQGPKAKAKAGVRDKGRLAAVARSEYFWCFKVCATLVDVAAGSKRALGRLGVINGLGSVAGRLNAFS